MDTKNEISARFIKAFNTLLSMGQVSDKKDFASKLGISPSMVTEISKGRSSVGLTAIQNIVLLFNVSSEWLLTGEGDMLKEKDVTTTLESVPADLIKEAKDVYPIGESAKQPDAIPLAEASDLKCKPIPLVTAKAAAGFGGGDFRIMEEDVKEYYVIPKFRHCNVDFMIEVSGTSMFPHYNPGDVIACSILHDTHFIQWNKCHVIATREQGILVKRLLPGDDAQHLKAVSDNKEYLPFDIPVDEITGIALVVGSVSLE